MKSVPLVLVGVALLSGFAALASGETADALARRYPYDPACPWGRIANGKGVIVRCLGEAEAEAMRAGVVAPAVPSSSSAVPIGSASNGAPPLVEPAVASGGDGSKPDPSPPPTTNGGEEPLDVTVGPVAADSGQLGIGKLAAPRDKYLRCVRDNGGLRDAVGEVQVRFLLRQRGRAEGVSVAKRTGLSVEAARCVSEVVDRRFVGVPDEPIVGATLTVRFSKAAK